jgi:hypothetical protein
MSSFKNIINQEPIYVDKTDLIAEVIKYNQPFLSRPGDSVNLFFSTPWTRFSGVKPGFSLVLKSRNPAMSFKNIRFSVWICLWAAHLKVICWRVCAEL